MYHVLVIIFLRGGDCQITLFRMIVNIRFHEGLLFEDDSAVTVCSAKFFLDVLIEAATVDNA